MSGLTWEGDLTTQINQFGLKAKRGMVAGAKMVEPQALKHMKENAPWTDRTGNARNGLSAKTIVENNKVSIVLYHTVPYGPYLELRWSGRYQIIQPTVEMFAPILAATIAKLIFD